MPQVSCPICKTPSEYAPANPWRPFCSERCKMIDLGAWASGQYSIPTPLDPLDPLNPLNPEAARDSTDPVN